MTKREKIILIVTVVVAFYGIFEFFFKAAPETVSTPAVQNSNPPEAFKSEMMSALTEDSHDKIDAYILERASSEWPAKPFLKSGLPVTTVATEQEGVPATADTPVTSFTYAGYLAVGEKKLAVINGIEYGVSELLPETGYTVERIEPLFVRLNGINGEKDITLTLQETD